jgi:hypothetical protein
MSYSHAEKVRSLGPIEDLLLGAIDTITDPENDENAITSASPTPTPTTGFPSILPTTEKEILVVTGSPTSTPSVTPTTPTPTTGFPSILPTTEKGILGMTGSPTSAPSVAPSRTATSKGEVSDTPSNAPSLNPSMEGTSVVVANDVPSRLPSTILSNDPSSTPSATPSVTPSSSPSDLPSSFPSKVPSSVPSHVPSSLPSMVPSSVPSDIPSSFPSLVPSSVPSNVPSAAESDIRSSALSNVPSTAASDVPSSVVSNVPSAVASYVPSSVSSDGLSEYPSDAATTLPSSMPFLVPTTPTEDVTTVTNSPTLLNTESIAVVESTCTQFLWDYLPLVQPDEYSDLACTVVNQTMVLDNMISRRMEDEALVTFRTKDVDLLLEVTGEAQGGTDFAQVVSKTFETFGEELEKNLVESSAFFRDEGSVTEPIVPEKSASPSNGGMTMDWIVLGGAIAGGVCLALVVSLFLVKKRLRHNNKPERTLSNERSKSFSVSSFRETSSFREAPLIKLVSIEATRSLQKDEEEDCMNIPPTPMGEDIPENLVTSPVDIQSELSPASFFGECGGCYQGIQHHDTFEGIIVHQSTTFDATNEVDHVEDGNATLNTGMSSYGMTYETGDKTSREEHLSMSDSSELEGLRLIGSNTNTNANTFLTNDESKAGIEQKFVPPATERRGFFYFARPASLRKRRTQTENNVTMDSGDMQDCCANDSWTIRTNSLVTPRKANTTNSIKAKSGSF